MSALISDEVRRGGDPFTEAVKSSSRFSPFCRYHKSVFNATDISVWIVCDVPITRVPDLLEIY